jgi:cell wall-associated NlpC family hydrolase
MTTTRTTAVHRLTRGSFALLAGAGIVLAPSVAQASSEPAPASSSSESYPAAPNQAAQTAVDTAMDQRGKPYEYGAAGPGSYDCSGLTYYSWRAAGVELPRTSRDQSQTGTPVARGDLQPGDLVFFYDPVSHVGVYVGNDQVVHSPTEGDVVKVSDIDAIGSYNSARRVG